MQDACNRTALPSYSQSEDVQEYTVRARGWHQSDVIRQRLHYLKNVDSAHMPQAEVSQAGVSQAGVSQAEVSQAQNPPHPANMDEHVTPDAQTSEKKPVSVAS
jgi:hypothetical protein